MVRKVEADEDRFWRKVDRAGPIPRNRPDLGPCWLWMGSNIRGYGQFSVGSRTDGTRGQVKAHRFAYELEEPIPEGLTLDHLCRTRPCVRRSHLEPVTGAVNVLRGETVVARNAAKTTCARGHQFDSTTHDGRHRVCRTCGRENQAAYRARHATPRVPKQLTDEDRDRRRAKNREYTRAYRERKRAQQITP